MIPSAYELNEEHSRILHQIINLPLDEDLPEKLMNEYWKYKRCCDRASIRVLEQDLARICAATGYGDAVERVKQTIPAAWKAGGAKFDDNVVVQWGHGTRNGVLKGVTAAGEVIVVLDGEGEERKMKASKVELAEAVGV